MRQPVREVAVVGQDQQSFGVAVQPADVKQPVLLTFGDEISDCAPAFWIAHCGHHTARFVQCQVSVPARRWNPGAVNTDDIPLWIDPSALLGNDFGVDFDASFADEDLASATRGNSSGSQDLL